jgi:sialic acid synthase SpsE/CMP-N-acetylneuraminic acid synthetase
VLVSTDDALIAQVAAEAGAEIVLRPAELAGDEATSESAVLHALDAAAPKAEIAVLVQCTSPFLIAADIAAVVAAVADGSADAAFTAAPSHGFLWQDNGSAVNHDPSSRPRRQDRPAQLLETGGAYAMRVSGLREARHRFFGRILPVRVDPARVLEIDTAWQLDYARTLAPLLDGVARPVRHVGSRPVGPGHPTYVVAEIGINHNGSLDAALALIDVAAQAGCDAVKFQKRTPAICVPEEYRDVERETPWGRMTYLDYRSRIEFGAAEYDAIARYCAQRGVAWFASPWDQPSVEFLERFEPPAYKVSSACLTDDDLLTRLRRTGRTVILSTGMSTPSQIARAVDALDRERLVLCHSTSSYPARPSELNLRMIRTLAATYPDLPIGYSGHEVGLQTTVAAVALGACYVERHITLDRTTWGSDHAASVEPGGFTRLVRDIRTVEAALGDGVKRIYDSELPMQRKLRRPTLAGTK